MVEKIIIKSKSVLGIVSLNQWMGNPSSAELNREVSNTNPYTITITTEGLVKEQMAKDDTKGTAKYYVFFIKSALKSFRIKNKRDYSIEVI